MFQCNAPTMVSQIFVTKSSESKSGSMQQLVLNQFSPEFDSTLT